MVRALYSSPQMCSGYSYFKGNGWCDILTILPTQYRDVNVNVNSFLSLRIKPPIIRESFARETSALWPKEFLTDESGQEL